MKPSAYKHIAAFCRVTGSSDAVRRAQQRVASRDNAPVDAVYLNELSQRWATIASVGVRTRMAIEIELNRGSKS